jgi:dTDP-4-dehydrorhamnose reductase
MKPNVMILGANGMLGWTVSRYFYQHREDFSKLIFTVRNDTQEFRKLLNAPDAYIFEFDATKGNLILDEVDYVINCIGMINKVITHEKVDLAWDINMRFVERLASEALNTGTKILHISTDCVYSGVRGGYDEGDVHDVSDTYGLSKSHGEINNQLMHIIRCSIVGHELNTKLGLLEWFLSHTDGETVEGYHNHLWNGITTLAYAKLMHTVITRQIDLPWKHHFIPLGSVSKAELLKIFAREYNRENIKIKFINAPTTCIRTLDTIHKQMNADLWKLMGYKEIPSISYLIGEMQKWQKKYSQL